MTELTQEQRLAAVRRLRAEQCSCVIAKGDDMAGYRERGVKDLFRLLKERPEELAGAFVADKVVGKGAAALMILGGVRDVYAGIISRSALGLLEGAGVKVEMEHCVPHIINRSGTGICPVEMLCRDCVTAEECLLLIENFMKSL
ncbi:MAG: DUF1893 domain-containing protein [Paraprevotella sp.]|nr:DUF1893 domain-containing protein [Paraprevotella sp.]